MSLAKKWSRSIEERGRTTRKELGKRSCESEIGWTEKEVARKELGKRSEEVVRIGNKSDRERGRTTRKEVVRIGQRSCESTKLRTRAVGKFLYGIFLHRYRTPAWTEHDFTSSKSSLSKIQQILNLHSILGHKIKAI